MTAPSKRAAEHSSQSAVAPDDVARRAYGLFEERGCEAGCDLDDWLHAERD